MTDWSSSKVVDLRAALSRRNLSTKGLKAELVQRLTEDDATAAAAQADQEPAVEDETPVEVKSPAVEADGISNEITEPQLDFEANEAKSAVANANVETLAQPEPASEAPTSQELASNGNDFAQTVRTDQPASDIPLTSTEVVADLQKRKRRSITPQPSVKRARQDGERQAESREGVATPENEQATATTTNNNNNNNNHLVSVSPKKSPNGVEDRNAAPEDADMTGQETHTAATSGARSASREPLEVSGEDAYAKRVTIAESSNLRSTSVSQSRGPSLTRDEEGVFDNRKTSAQQPGPLVDESGEDAYAKRVAIAESSKLQSTSLPQFADQDTVPSGAPSYPSQPQQSYEYTKHDDPQHAQASGLGGANDSSLPSEHTPTSALYIRELMRPLKSEAMEQYIVDLISSAAKHPDSDPIHDFYLDQIRTHAFVRLPSISAAQLVRAALHNQVWPNERNRKALWVDFIPAESVKDWIEREENAPRGSRWEVVYEQTGRSIIAVHREVGVDAKSFSRPPPTGPAAAGPVYPGIEMAPRGPRGGNGAGAGDPRARFQHPNTRRTDTVPQIAYVPKDEDMVRRRIDNMRYFYSRDPPPDLGKDYHRYTFETADSFVDRGREVFIGIRPPHRQREHEERLAAGDGYQPPPRPPVTDENRFNRYGDSRRSDRPDWPPRNRGFRNDRGPPRYRGEDPYRYRPGY